MSLFAKRTPFQNNVIPSRRVKDFLIKFHSIMLSTISKLNWVKRTPFWKLLGNSICQKNVQYEARVLLNTELLGYAQAVSIRFPNCSCEGCCRKKFFSSKNNPNNSQGELDPLQFDKISEETLESLTEYFDELVEKAEHLDEADVSYGDGVLTIKFGKDFGTYVINRQTPNKQIWLSSPKSGPKRYDFIDGKWIYKHDGRSIYELLDDEIPKIVKNNTKFRECSYSVSKKFD